MVERYQLNKQTIVTLPFIHISSEGRGNLSTAIDVFQQVAIDIACTLLHGEIHTHLTTMSVMASLYVA